MKGKKLIQKFYIKVYKHGLLASSFDTSKSRRFLHRCRAEKFSDSMKKKVYVKVTYPYNLYDPVLDKEIQGYNDGTYSDSEELLKAVTAFLEK